MISWVYIYIWGFFLNLVFLIEIVIIWRIWAVSFVMSITDSGGPRTVWHRGKNRVA